MSMMDDEYCYKSLAERKRIKPDTPEDFLPDLVKMVKAMEEDVSEREGKVRTFTLDDFEIGCPLGRGKFGRVYLAREKKSKFMVALKTMFLSELKKYNMELQILREIDINTHLKHPNILRMFCGFLDQRRCYLVLEFAGLGEVFSILQSMDHHRFPNPQTAKYIYQVASALDYCHSMNVMHRDIKPENLLLDFSDNIKLADFGWSVHSVRSKRVTMCGTLDYLPPEIVRRQPYTTTVDNWCLGILCYEFLTGHAPFESASTNETYRKILSLDIHYPSHLSEGSKNLIRNLLKIDPHQRITLKQAMKHKWIVENKHLPYPKPT